MSLGATKGEQQMPTKKQASLSTADRNHKVYFLKSNSLFNR